jgi:hypothetical protein
MANKLIISIVFVLGLLGCKDSSKLDYAGEGDEGFDVNFLQSIVRSELSQTVEFSSVNISDSTFFGTCDSVVLNLQLDGDHIGIFQLRLKDNDAFISDSIFKDIRNINLETLGVFTKDSLTIVTVFAKDHSSQIIWTFNDLRFINRRINTSKLNKVFKQDTLLTPSTSPVTGVDDYL